MSKYTLPRDLPPPTVDRDFEPPKPERPASFGRVIAGMCVLVCCFSWPALFIALEVVAK